jgi:pseudaminic acid synthase
VTPFIVAEMSASHLGSLDRAMAIVKAAHAAGADAVKLQTWSEMSVCATPLASGPWAGRTLPELYERCRTPWEWHAPIFERCRELGMVGFSTPFDEPSVDFLESLGVPVYKIASFEITHRALIRRAAATGKPLVLSTGMATAEEIEEAVSEATTAGAGGITLLKCVSSYPAPAEGFNVITMAHMAEAFGCHAGLSDHTRGSTVAVAATALGAVMIEKHISLDRDGPDGDFACTPHEFAAYVREIRTAGAAIGGVMYGPADVEADSLHLRRSLWITRDVAVGEPLTRDNVAVLRPVGGLAPEHFEAMLGERVTRACARGTPLTLEVIR